MARTTTLLICCLTTLLLAPSAAAEHPTGPEYYTGPGAAVGQDGLVLGVCPRACPLPFDVGQVPAIGVVEVSVDRTYSNVITRANDDIYGSNAALRICLADDISDCATPDAHNTSDWSCVLVAVIGTPVPASTAHVWVAPLYVGDEFQTCGASHGNIMPDFF